MRVRRVLAGPTPFMALRLRTGPAALLPSAVLPRSHVPTTATEARAFSASFKSRCIASGAATSRPPAGSLPARTKFLRHSRTLSTQTSEVPAPRRVRAAAEVPPPTPAPAQRHAGTPRTSDISLAGRAILGRLNTTGAAMALRHGEHRERLISGQRATAMVQSSLVHLWAESTWSGRASLWERFRIWSRRENLSPTPDTAALFAEASALTKQGAYANARTLSGIFFRLGTPHASLLTLVTALRKQGAGVPVQQAKPMTRDLMARYARQEWVSGDRRLAAAVLLAWKSSSRWKEASQLPRHRRPPQGCRGGAGIILLSPEKIVVDFWTLPKGYTEDPYKPGRFVVIVGPLTDILARMLTELGDFAVLCPLTTSALDRRWARDPQMRGFGGHSLKRGAIDHLDRLEVTSGLPGVQPFDRAHTHKHSAGPADPCTRMGHLYGSDDLVLAHKFGTQRVTKFL